MKILFVVSHYYPYIGGVEYVVKSIAERLAKKGHEVNVLCGEQGIDKPIEEDVDRVAVTRWPVYAPGDAYHIPRMKDGLMKWLSETAKTFDVVHFHSVHSVFTMYSLNILRYHDIHKVLTPHYHGTGHTLPRRILWGVWRGYVKRAVTGVDVVHSVSRYEAQLVRRDFVANPVVIEHGVEEWIPKVSWNPSGYAMYSGRIEKYKNIHRLANVVKYLNEMGFDLEFKIFGEGTFRKKLEKQIRELGVKYEINPPQPYEKYIECLSRADLFGLLSQREAFGQTVNEANAIGTPVVVTEPWGFNFSGRSRTLVINLSKDDKVIAREVAEFLKKARDQPKPMVPGWHEVVDLYVKLLYSETQRGGHT